MDFSPLKYRTLWHSRREGHAMHEKLIANINFICKTPSCPTLHLESETWGILNIKRDGSSME